MRLNMWMIANRLTALEPELHIPQNPPVNLLSARRAYATQCVYVYQKGKNVICDGGEEGGYIIFHDMDCEQVFEMIQYTFDFYQEWQDMLIEAAGNLDYKRIIDQSWTIFHNPLILLDTNYKVLFLSEQYGADEVNNDWKYLCENGRSSVDAIHYLMQEGKKNNYYLSGKAKLYHFNGKDIDHNMISAAIYFGNDICGRLNIIEHDRRVNAGDLYLADYITKYLSIILGKIQEQQRSKNIAGNIFERLMKNQEVSPSDLNYWKQYQGWSDEDIYQVLTFSFYEKPDIHNVISLCNLVQNEISDSLSFQLDGYVSVVHIVKDKEKRIEKITHIFKEMPVYLGISLLGKGFSYLPYYYQQTLAAIKLGRIFSPEKEIWNFYGFGADYLLSTGLSQEMLYACHPDIKTLWEEEKDGEKIRTLWTYLKNDCSLINTANELFIHRNTLIYRLKKITDKFQYSIEDLYTRDYMKLSLRILMLYNSDLC